MSAKLTLRQRGAIYFGSGNTKDATGVRVGRHRYVFVKPHALWIYEENPSPRGVVLNLSERAQWDLTNALYHEGWPI